MNNKVHTENRLNFLKDSFGIFDSDKHSFKTKQFIKNGFGDVIEVTNDDDLVLALIAIKKSNIKICICDKVFDLMVQSDPSSNNIYTQWMLNVFSKLLKQNNSESINSAIRFVNEDLPLAKEYLKIFDTNKRKVKFNELCKNSFILKGISNPKDINQYKSLGQLYDAVDPFIEKDSSEMEKLLYKFVDSGLAEIPVRDRKFTLFIPKTRDANVLFNKFTNWCTAKPDNGMFTSYTNNKTPSNKKSQIFIIIKNEFFDGILNDDTLHQIHFETNQIKCRKNLFNVDIFEKIILQSDGLSNYFYEILLKMAKQINSTENNNYLDYLIQFGFSDALFEFYDSNVDIIRLKNKRLSKLPDISKFKNLEILEIDDCGLTELHPSISYLKNLEILILPNNKLNTLPSELGDLKKLKFINLINNKVKTIFENVKNLDKLNGGSLHRILITRNDIGELNYNKLIKLLPNTLV
jgi:hypothetical protein